MLFLCILHIIFFLEFGCFCYTQQWYLLAIGDNQWENIWTSFTYPCILWCKCVCRCIYLILLVNSFFTTGIDLFLLIFTEKRNWFKPGIQIVQVFHRTSRKTISHFATNYQAGPRRIFSNKVSSVFEWFLPQVQSETLHSSSSLCLMCRLNCCYLGWPLFYFS